MVPSKYADGVSKECFWPTDSKPLLHYRLDQFRFRYLKGTKPQRLIALVNRAERGFLSYDVCSSLELRSFCAARRLPVESRMTFHLKPKPAMVRILEAADNAVTFTRFADLPTEVRMLVYDLYFRDMAVWRESGTNIRRPPITTASTLTRQEALPAWYHFWTFSMQLRFYQNSNKSGPIRISNKRFFQNMPSECLSNIHHIEIDLDDHPKKLTLDLTPRNQASRMTIVDTVVRYREDEWLDPRFWGKVWRLVGPIVDAVGARPVAQKERLTFKDLQDVSDAIAAAWQECE